MTIDLRVFHLFRPPGHNHAAPKPRQALKATSLPTHTPSGSGHAAIQFDLHSTSKPATATWPIYLHCYYLLKQWHSQLVCLEGRNIDSHQDELKLILQYIYRYRSCLIALSFPQDFHTILQNKMLNKTKLEEIWIYSKQKEIVVIQTKVDNPARSQSSFEARETFSLSPLWCLWAQQLTISAWRGCSVSGQIAWMWSRVPLLKSFLWSRVTWRLFGIFWHKACFHITYIHSLVLDFFRILTSTFGKTKLWQPATKIFSWQIWEMISLHLAFPSPQHQLSSTSLALHSWRRTPVTQSERRRPAGGRVATRMDVLTCGEPVTWPGTEGWVGAKETEDVSIVKVLVRARHARRWHVRQMKHRQPSTRLLIVPPELNIPQSCLFEDILPP